MCLTWYENPAVFHATRIIIYRFRYNWKTFLKEHFLPMKGIRKYHHFRVTKDDLGVVYVKTGSERDETRINILRRGVQIPRDVYLTSVPAAGLSRERAKYLFQTVRPLVRTAFQVQHAHGQVRMNWRHDILKSLT